MIKQFFLFLIRFYQRYLNFNHFFWRFLFLTDRVCRFKPTCSEYTYQAITKYGTIRGLYLGLRRIIKCHPFSTGGDDPIPHDPTKPF